MESILRNASRNDIVFDKDIQMSTIMDAVWKLTTRVYLLEGVIGDKFGEYLGVSGYQTRKNVRNPHDVSTNTEAGFPVSANNTYTNEEKRGQRENTILKTSAQCKNSRSKPQTGEISEPREKGNKRKLIINTSTQGSSSSEKDPDQYAEVENRSVRYPYRDSPRKWKRAHGVYTTSSCTSGEEATQRYIVRSPSRKSANTSTRNKELLMAANSRRWTSNLMLREKDCVDTGKQTNNNYGNGTPTSSTIPSQVQSMDIGSCSSISSSEDEMPPVVKIGSRREQLESSDNEPGSIRRNKSSLDVTDTDKNLIPPEIDKDIEDKKCPENKNPPATKSPDESSKRELGLLPMSGTVSESDTLSPSRKVNEGDQGSAMANKDDEAENTELVNLESEITRDTGGIRFVKTARGNDQLVDELNHTYSVLKVAEDGSKFWRCSKYFKLKCQGTLKTLNDKLISRGEAHNHGGDSSNKKRKIV